MIYSMTGFGRAVVNTETCRITVEAKSLNSKQLDLSIRMPLRFREDEIKLREYIGKRLERGKIDLNVYYEIIDFNADGNALSTEFNVNMLGALKNKITSACNQLDIAEPSDWFQIFLRIPEVIHSDKPIPMASDTERSKLMEAVQVCIDNLMNFRKNEGIGLGMFLTKRIENIQNELTKVDKYENERVSRIKDKLTEGLSKLSQVEYDKNRLEQELIFYIEKLDVSEEKQRLGQHLEYFLATLNLTDPGQGKKLGFIAQEIGREINTLGSKSNHAELQKIVVRMKDELEQIKEQVLNVM